MLAGMARGTLHRVVSTAEGAFRRIEQSLAGYYLLGVEPGTNDRDGRRHKIEVKTPRRGVTLQARRAFLSPEGPPAASPAEALTRTLRSSMPATALPMRASTWTYKEPGTSRVRLVVAAEVERATDDPLDYATGLVIATKEGKVVAASEDARQLTPIAGDETRASYAGVIVVDPGTYRMRIALADSEKRAGSLEREVLAWQLNGETLTLGDLLVAPAAAGRRRSGAARRAAHPRRHAGGDGRGLRAARGPDSRVVTARLDILRDESSRVLVSTPLAGVGRGRRRRCAWRRAASASSAVPPGAYLARVSFTEGGAARGALIRPFRVLAPPPLDGRRGCRPRPHRPSCWHAVLGITAGRDEGRRARSGHDSGTVDGDRTGRTAPVLAAIKTARERPDDRRRARSAGRRRPGGGRLRTRDGPAREVADRPGGRISSRRPCASRAASAPARAMLGVCLLLANREKEAAGLLMSVPPDTIPAFGRLAGEAWLKAGQPEAAVAPLAQVGRRATSGRRRDLALAYALTGNAARALPLLTSHLAGAGATDGPALAAGVYSLYRRHAAAIDPSTIDGDRTQARAWARAYAATRGPLAPIVEAWTGFLEAAQ